jgi:hypothetical protein
LIDPREDVLLQEMFAIDDAPFLGDGAVFVPATTASAGPPAIKGPRLRAAA